MAAYIVAQLDVKNTDWQKEYGPKAGALVQKHGGKVIAGARKIPLLSDNDSPFMRPLLHFFHLYKSL